MNTNKSVLGKVCLVSKPLRMTLLLSLGLFFATSGLQAQIEVPIAFDIYKNSAPNAPAVTVAPSPISSSARFIEAEGIEVASFEIRNNSGETVFTADVDPDNAWTVSLTAGLYYFYFYTNEGTSIVAAEVEE
ncbi:MAG: hypothetical protein OHK0039_38340 [Bacteroidia bacterium]